MRFPPLDYDDLVSLGMAADSVLSQDDSGLPVCVPPPPKLMAKLLAAAQASPPPFSSRMAYLRHVRDLLMSLTDYTQAADSPLTEQQREAWATYRQSLRDLPQAYSGEGPIPWPVAP